MTHNPTPPAFDPAAPGDPFHGASTPDGAPPAATPHASASDAVRDGPIDHGASDEDGGGPESSTASVDAEPARRRRRGRRGGAGRRGRGARSDGAAHGDDDARRDGADADAAGGDADRGDVEHGDGDRGDGDRGDGDRGGHEHGDHELRDDENGDGAADAAQGDGAAAGRRKKRRRRGKRGKRAAGEHGDGDTAAGSEGEPASDDGAHEHEHDHADEGEPAGTASDGEAGGKRSRRSRRKRGARKDGADAPAAAGAAAAAGGKRKKRGRRGGRRRDGEERDEREVDEAQPLAIEAIPGEEDDLAELEPARKTARRAKPAEDLDAPKQVEVARDQRILVNAADPEEARVVVVEGQRIVDLQMTVRDHESYVNDIYRGRVVNLETAIGAAFVDFGQGRNGFLHVSDVMEVYGEPDWSLDKLLTARTAPEEWGEGGKAEEIEGEEKATKRTKSKASRSRPRKRRAINELLQKGQTVAVQITKDAIGDKGPTLTTYISIPGRYLVLMPSLQRTGVSRKIEDEKERRRLKRILEGLAIPEGMGIIVRTAGVGRTKQDIQRDLDYLIAVWEDFSKKLVLGRNPAPLYQESDVAIRTMRDLFSARTETVVVDSPKVFEHMREFTRKLMPEHLDRIVLHEAPKPLFHHYGIEADYERIFARRVELPSGGSIVIDQTEALVAIDVNSGRTRDEGADFEDIALKTNLEAAPEIARQIRLRDLGGIVVLDFIDMLRQSSRKLVERKLRECLATDRARSKVGRISQFGLLELTRQRLGPGLSRLVYDTCPTCKGSGRRRTAQSRAQAVLRRLSSALTQKGFTKIEVVAHHDTVEWLQKRNRAELEELQERAKREVVLKGVDEQAEESIFHYLRADGREVRPGGRRKR